MPFNLQTELWNARWISVPGTGAQDYGVYYFRKDVDLSVVPEDYVVHVTGDNRYKLYVNGTLVSMGPAKGDVPHWRYETVDLAPYLKAGKNRLAALVYHEGPEKPENIYQTFSKCFQNVFKMLLTFTDKIARIILGQAQGPFFISVLWLWP